MFRSPLRGLCLLPGWMLCPAVLQAAPPEKPPLPARVPDERDWLQLEQCVDGALMWLASRQQPDGSFPSLDNGQPAVTALVALAFLSTGRGLEAGKGGDAVDRAIRYLLASQKPSGLIARVAPEQGDRFREIGDAQAAAYNHAIAGLALSELYGMTPGRHERIRPVLERAIQYALERQPFPKRRPGDAGGWRYRMRYQNSDSDLSVTSWYLMFLRSCRNAGFDVPADVMDEGTAYVMRSFDPASGSFWYALQGREHVTTKAMTAAGILSLSMAGRHHTDAALKAGNWILAHPDAGYLRGKRNERFFYPAFYCSQAMFQLGGRYWEVYYPRLLEMLSEGQHVDGSWDAEPSSDRIYGNAYTTALAVLALSPPYQVLPIFQR